MQSNHLHEVKTAWVYVLRVRDQRHSTLEEEQK